MASLCLSASLQAEVVTPQRQQDLQNFLLQDCGSCHGMTLKGGLGPSLLPERLSQLPSDFLIDSILLGRPGTPMPPWQGLLSKSDVEYLVQLMQQGVAHE